MYSILYESEKEEANKQQTFVCLFACLIFYLFVSLFAKKQAEKQTKQTKTKETATYKNVRAADA